MHLAFLEFICIRKKNIFFIHIYLFLNIWKPKNPCICLYNYCQVKCIKHILYIYFQTHESFKKIMHFSQAFPEFSCIIGFARKSRAPLPKSVSLQDTKTQSINIQLFHGSGGSLALGMLGINSISLTFICLPLMKVTQAAYSS